MRYNLNMGKASENWLKIAKYDLGAAENALKGGFYIRVPAKVPFIFTNGTSEIGRAHV